MGSMSPHQSGTSPLTRTSGSRTTRSGSPATHNELWDPESEDPAGVAIAYGVAAWHLYNGRAEPAGDMFRRILEGSGWAGFGYIAAEAEIARLSGR